jgi:hypothetical protein
MHIASTHMLNGCVRDRRCRSASCKLSPIWKSSPSSLISFNVLSATDVTDNFWSRATPVANVSSDCCSRSGNEFSHVYESAIYLGLSLKATDLSFPTRRSARLPGSNSRTRIASTSLGSIGCEKDIFGNTTNYFGLVSFVR